jgi:hypothetical protein
MKHPWRVCGGESCVLEQQATPVVCSGGSCSDRLIIPADSRSIPGWWPGILDFIMLPSTLAHGLHGTEQPTHDCRPMPFKLAMEEHA